MLRHSLPCRFGTVLTHEAAMDQVGLPGRGREPWDTACRARAASIPASRPQRSNTHSPLTTGTPRLHAFSRAAPFMGCVAGARRRAERNTRRVV